MSIFILPAFGPVDTESLEEYNEVELQHNGLPVQIHLNFSSQTIGVEKLELVKQFIDNIRIHDLNNHKHIGADYRDEGCETVRKYLEHHLEELGENELANLITPGTKPATYMQQLLKKLQLVTVNIYPEGEGEFAVFDYSLGKDVTDYLLVIATDENGNLEYMTMEH